MDFSVVHVPSSVLVLGFVLMLCSATLAQGFRWKTAEPESVGMSAQKLNSMRDTLASKETDCLLVVRNDRIVLEWYSKAYSARRGHYIASLSKSMVGGMSLLVALQEGKLKPDDRACKFVPQWKGDPRKSRITIEHLASHTSGLGDTSPRKKSTYKDEFWLWPNHYAVARDEVPTQFDPGTGSQYSNPGMAMLGYCITAAMKDTDTPDIKSILTRRVMDPIGAKSGWGISFYGRGKPVQIDGLKLYATWGGGTSTARVAARVGRLMLRKGNWEGKQVLSKTWVERVIEPVKVPRDDRTKDPAAPMSGLCWWVNTDGVWKDVPKDAFAGAGAQNQVLFVVPSLDLIVVRLGRRNLGQQFWRGLELHLFTPVVRAVVSGTVRPSRRKLPYPPSPVLKGVKWAPVSEIVRKGVDSDNWPITWGDDGHQYTAYGDGWGFKPRTKRKLSNGIARIVGGPTRFRGENIRTKTGETVGDDVRAPKASGMLMVDGVLYMWMRNVRNSQLAWSKDHGRTWTWADWRFTTSFGCPTFLNFGKDYVGARDEYVYTCSQDGPSAYVDCDGVVLARVNKRVVTDRKRYEFFVGTDADGNSVWSKDIRKRRHVFNFPGHCGRMDIVYHPRLKRYLLALAHRNKKGAWGIFDAPEPWGPWTTVFYTDDWGLGNVHGFRLPGKWLDRDGKTFRLVFSGRPYKGVNWDSFCVRKGVFISTGLR